MIHLVSGDILLSKAELVVHGVAADDDFKNGLALALRQACPDMYRDFRHWCKQQHPRPGSLWLWQGVDRKGRRIRLAALLTQEPPTHAGGHPGKARTEYVNGALHELKKLVEREHIQSVALPRLATGVGGLDWPHVLPLIRAQLGELAAAVVVYAEFRAGVAAAEPLGGQQQP